MKKAKLTVAILGATGTIGKSLIYQFLKNKNFKILYLYSRNFQKLDLFLENLLLYNDFNYDNIIYAEYEYLNEESYDIIINCIGVGTNPENYSDYFTINEHYDNLVLNYLQKHKNTLYISISSGAIYGNLESDCARKHTFNLVNINDIKKQDYYSITRLYLETKHRSLEDLNIADLRLFNFFSRFNNLDDNYFIADIINCCKDNKLFITNQNDFYRDFLHPEDLYNMIIKCYENIPLNQFFDMCSLLPIGKFSIINYFKQNYKLQVEIQKDKKFNSGTGNKVYYYSDYNGPCEKIGFVSKYTSLECIDREIEYILGKRV